MNVVIFDDEAYFRELCHGTISKFNNLNLFGGEKLNIVLSTGTYSEAVNYSVMNDFPTIYLIDIMVMGETEGFRLVDFISSQTQANKIIFITGYQEFIIHNYIYKDKCVDFLIKHTETFEEGLLYWLRKSVKLLSGKNVFSFKIQSEKYYVLFEEIYYFEKVKGLNKITLCGLERICEFYATVGEVMKKLDGRFFQCHRSFIVNKDKIQEIHRNYLLLENGETIPCGRSFIWKNKDENDNGY